MKIKILHVLNSPSIGGIETFVYYLTKMQQSNPQLEVSILFSRSEGNLKDRFISTGIKCYFLDIKPFDLDVRKYIRFAKISSNFDILHFHTFLPMRELIAARLNPKIVYTQHSVDGFGRVKKKTDAFRKLVFRHFLNHQSDYVTFNSEYTREFWSQQGVANTRSKVVYNGVTFETGPVSHKNDEPVFHIDPGKFVIGTSSRFISWKRVDLLIRSFATFQAGKEDVLLLLVGDGNEMGELVKLVRELNIEDKVVFTGYTTNVTYYQSLMDVCVFPSTTEAFGLVAIECMYLGKPVLVFNDGGGITELIQKIEPENVVNDPDMLAGSLNHYYHNRELLTGENEKKRKSFAESFDMKIAENQFYDIYTQL